MDAKSRFKVVREHTQLSMDAFGKAIGLSASGVSAIEYGTRCMGEKHVKLICAAFPEISEDWLRTGEGEMLKPKSNADLISGLTDSPVIRAILEAYLELTPQNRKIFEDFFSDVCRRHAESQTPPGDAAMSAARAGEEPRPVQPESLSG